MQLTFFIIIVAFGENAVSQNFISFHQIRKTPAECPGSVCCQLENAGLELIVPTVEAANQ